MERNKFKVSKISAKLYTKQTGIKVDKNKIIDSKASVQDNKIFDQQLKNYYGTVSLKDQKRSITSDNDLHCHSQYSKGKNNTPSRYEIIKNSKFGKPNWIILLQVKLPLSTSLFSY